MSDLTRLRAAQKTILTVPAGSAPLDLCGPCLEVLPVAGAAVSLLAGTMQQETLCSSDLVAERLDELQFDLGEGPCWKALDTGRPVLVPDVRGVEHPAWPHFAAAAAADTDAAGIFAFPVRMGGVDLGALNLYTTSPGPLAADVVHAAGVLADTLGWAVMRHLLQDTGHDTGLVLAAIDGAAGNPAESTGAQSTGMEVTGVEVAAGRELDRGTSRREVHQAVGMVLAQVGTTHEGAFALLRARAFTEDRSMKAVARDVLARRVNFE